MAFVETVKARPKPMLQQPTLPTIDPWGLAPLVWAANAFVERADKADDKSRQQRTAAGITLVEIKRRFGDISISERSERTWDAFCAKHFRFNRRRADQLIAFVEGRADEEETKKTERARIRLLRNSQKKQKDAPAVRTADKADDDIEAEIDPDPDTRRLAFLLRADQARLFAVYSGPVDEDVCRIAREALAAWTLLVQQLSREMNNGKT